MKKMYRLQTIIYSLLFTLFSISSFGQEITLEKLFNFNNMDFETFDFEVSIEGFQYLKTMEDDFSKSYTYNFNNKSGQSSTFFTRSTYKESKGRYLSFQCSQNMYTDLKLEGKKLGMVFVKVEDSMDGNGYYTKYKLGNYILAFWISKSAEKKENVYEVYIEEDLNSIQ